MSYHPSDDELYALLQASTCRVAGAFDKVLNAECCYTFHSPYTTDQGILVHLNTFVGTIQELALLDSQSDDKGIFVRIVKKRVGKQQAAAATADGASAATAAVPTKLGLGLHDGGFATEEDKYETISTHSVVLLEKATSGTLTVVAELPYTEETKPQFPTHVTQSVDSILCHVGLTTQQDVKAWQLDQTDIPVSKYANSNLPFVDNGVLIDPDPSTWACQKDGSRENLWLNLSDGYIGGGRKNWDGSGGSNGAVDHFEATGHQYPLVVKLGTITADLETADCYSYAPDEDGPVRIPNLAELLQKRGIQVAAMQKTVKSTAELEVELNANYAFDAITEAGAQLTPVSGPGLQGLQNLGNSCYMNAVLQLLFSGTVPELSHRYGTPPGVALSQHPILQRRAATTTTIPPADDFLCQTTKVASALTSGVFCQPIANSNDDAAQSVSNDPKYRLAPRMFKHLIGKNHVDFCTSQQQDAAQFLQYLLEQLDRAELGASQALLALTSKGNNNEQQPLHVASHLFSYSMTTRSVCSADQRVKYKDGAPETLWSLRIPMDKATTVVKESHDQKRRKADDEDAESKTQPVPSIAFSACVDAWAADTVVDDIRWPHLDNATHPATQNIRFTNFPRYLLVHLQRYQLGPDWQPVKLEVEVDIAEELDLNAIKTTGPKGDENLVPDDEALSSSSPSAREPPLDEMALSQLMDMGFSLNSCKRALTAVGGSNVEAAMGWVFDHTSDPDFNDPLPEDYDAMDTNSNGGAGNHGVDEDVVQSLVANLGCFTADQVRAALKETNGVQDRAVDWLFSHMDNLDAAIAALSDKGQQSGSSDGSNSFSGPKVPLEDGNGKYSMVGMVSHIGKHTGSGHYVAHLKKNGKWVIFNDEKVALSSEPPLAHAYMYLFQRTDTIGSPNPNY